MRGLAALPEGGSRPVALDLPRSDGRWMAFAGVVMGESRQGWILIGPGGRGTARRAVAPARSRRCRGRRARSRRGQGTAWGGMAALGSAARFCALSAGGKRARLAAWQLRGRSSSRPASSSRRPRACPPRAGPGSPVLWAGAGASSAGRRPPPARPRRGGPDPEPGARPRFGVDPVRPRAKDRSRSIAGPPEPGRDRIRRRDPDPAARGGRGGVPRLMRPSVNGPRPLCTARPRREPAA